MRWRVISMGWLLIAGSAAALEAGSRPDARLTTSSGGVTRLADQRGKPTVLFYEDRDSTKQNQALKDELFALGKERHLLEAVQVVAVANLKSWDWRPARDFALMGVRDAEKKFGIPIYVDFGGAFTSPPWALPPKASSVVLLDAEGTVRFVASGPLTKAEHETLFSALEALLPTGG